MRFELDALLSPETAASVRIKLLADSEDWVAGSATAGWHSRQVKRNRQLQRSSALHHSLAEQVSAPLLAHPLVQSAALPVRLHGLLFSRSGPGDGYGRHGDNAYMEGGRTDLSFTVFLSAPEEYEGGALVIEQPQGEEAFRLQAGHALVYPSTLLHRVEPVTAGERLVAVGWIQSRVRQAERRELLFELDTARRALFAQEGKGEVFDLLCRSYSNLLRMWGE